MANRIHCARQRLESVARQWPGFWSYADRWRDTCDLRGAYLIDSVVVCALTEYVCYYGSGVIGQAIRDSSNGNRTLFEYVHYLCTMACWRMTQGIYRVDPDLYPLLIDTSLGADLPVEPLRRLPEWCVYVETQGIPVAGHNCVGAFCRVDPGSGGSEWLKIGLDTDTGGFLPVDLPLRGTLQSCMDEAVASGALCEQDARTCIQACAPIINLLLYVCECADISGAHGRPANPAPVRTRRGGVKLFPASSPKMWDVGVRMGAALRAAYAATAGAQGGHTGASVRGHIRRAHWHGFYSGPKKTPDGAVIPADKRRFGLRWMPPIAVNLPDVDGLPATIRRVS